MKHDKPQRPTVTLEQLIRLKRAEQPPAEFWLDFDRAMRAKQLAAIVEPRPWWAPFIRLGTRVARYQLPVGATAVLALTFFTVNQYRLPQGEPVYVSALAQSIHDTATVGLNEAGSGAETLVNEQIGSAERVAVANSVTVTERPTAAPELQSIESAQMISMLGGSRASMFAANADSPSARSIAANLAQVKASEPELARLIDRAAGFDATNLVSRTAPVDPLTQMHSPADSNRVRRLLANYTSAPVSAEEAAAQRNAGRVGRGLSDERLYERVSRFDVEGERLAISIRL
jgi:hypothetical protein